MNQLFNANHSPIGAFAGFTLGYPGAKGGPGMETTGPVDTNVYIGAERREGNSFQAFPFFDKAVDESRRFDVEKATEDVKGYFDAFRAEDIKRTFTACTDIWESGDVKFELYNQVCSVPDPNSNLEEEIKEAIVPAVFARMIIDNRGCNIKRTVFIGFDMVEKDCGMRIFESGGRKGIGQGERLGIFTNEAAEPAIGFCPEYILSETLAVNHKFNLGNTAMLLLEAEPDKVMAFSFVICFFKAGQATYGRISKYYYTKYFKDMEAVAEYALEKMNVIVEKCLESDKRFTNDRLSPEQKFMLAHAIKSYYNSSQFLLQEENPLWIINEGEFRMMNTMDLTVDQLFFEIKMNPWTVINELEHYLQYYSYRDEVRFPGEEKKYEGGLTFCHDMGVANQFSRSGYSAYEKAGLTGCFSYMSHEQVVNWLCCALVYDKQSGDREWLQTHMDTIEACFQSMLNRDHPCEDKRNGVMGLDSTRTEGGAEITTYDSLDISLGQARNNIYLAGKCFAVYVALEKRFTEAGRPDLAEIAGEQAMRCADTLSAHLTEQGYIPAIIDEENDSKIIPAMEGLVFLFYTGNEEALQKEGKYGTYIRALCTHFFSIMQEGICLFPDGGWKLSSTSDNSWLSKIYLCEFVARKVFGADKAKYTQKADKAHVAWLTHKEHSYWCWSDQIISGVISASKYYPRGVTAILWLDE
ncbi:MAG: glycoside hydrolase family 52 protein [Anaerocolumna sp.]